MTVTRKFVAGAVVWAVASLVGVTLFFYVSPVLEARFAPVLIDQSVDNVVRRPGQVCWNWHWTKVRRAVPREIGWTILVGGVAASFPTIVYREQNGELAKVRNAPLGSGVSVLCAPMPEEFDRLGPDILSIRGQIIYDVPHGMWTIWQDVPNVPLPEMRAG